MTELVGHDVRRWMSTTARPRCGRRRRRSRGRCWSDCVRLVADRDRPLFVGLDGRSGSGKSTLTAVVKRDLESDGSMPVTVSVIEGDQFYGGGSSATWDARGPEEKAARVIDWRRQHDVLGRLHDAGVAEWRSFDWYADDWDADVVPLVAEPVTTLVSRVVILEGARQLPPRTRRRARPAGVVGCSARRSSSPTSRP